MHDYIFKLFHFTASVPDIIRECHHHVSIADKPVCLEGQKTIYGVSEGETAHISCRVDAFPEADVFSWSFNTSSGGMDLPRDSYTNQGRHTFLLDLLSK